MKKYQWYSAVSNNQSMVPLMEMKYAKEVRKGREISELTFIPMALKRCWLLSVANSESFCNGESPWVVIYIIEAHSQSSGKDSMHFLVILQQYNLDHMFVYPLHISRTTERHACLHLVFTLHQQFKKLLPCVDSINDSLNLEGLISCLQGSSEGEISECLLNTMKTFFFLRMCCWKRQLVNVGKLVCLSTLNHAKTNSPAKSA